MKKIFLVLMAIASATTALAVEKGELELRLRDLTARFESMQRQPDKAVPADIIQKAQGIVLLERTKAGLIFAYQGGNGVALAREPKTQQWSPVAFVSANEASLGPQIGAEQAFFVIFIMDTNVTRLLAEANFDFGGEARGTAGDASTGAGASLNRPAEPVLIFGDRKGLYGGAALKAGAISPDNDANRTYYEQYVTMNDVLFDRKVSPTEASKALAAKLAEFCNATKP